MVDAIADDVFGVQVGQMVFCDPFMAVPTNDGSQNKILIGWTGLEAESAKLQTLCKDGVWAEKALCPAECLTPIPEMQDIDVAALAPIGYLAIPYGGFLQGQLRPGQQVIINGATGGLGSAAVLVALAMSAARVVAVGRNEAALVQLEQLDPQRVVGVALKGDPIEDQKRLLQVAEGTDLVLDTLGGAKTPDPTLACIRTLRPSGTAVLMGGVKAEIPLPYAEIMLKQISIRGAFMYPRSAPGELLQMVKSGTLQLDKIQQHTFPLAEINAAIAEASTLKGLDYCIVAPTPESK